MTPLSRVLTTVFVAITLVIGVGVYLSVRDRENTASTQPADGGQLVREDSHRLTDVPESNVTLVEFLDFECEACGAYFPMVERLRDEYGDRVNFVVRYFPLQGHFNGERAARAVEAAAQQGQFEAMYKKMFETQTEWGEQRVPADDTFRGFAEELNLDMPAFDAAYNDPATVQRINADVADGTALGVQATPTFFLNGERIQPRSYEDFATAVQQALAE